MTPDVSIIIPAYNAATFIDKCVASVVDQSFANWELIIVDDGSKDNTLEVCLSLSKNDPRISVIHTNNYGAYEARMMGVKASNGKWIMFVDSDDSLPKNSLEVLLFNQNDNVDIIVGTLNLNGSSIFQHKISGMISQIDYIEALLKYWTSIGPYAKLYRHRLFNNQIVRPQRKIIIHEDLLMLLSISAYAKAILVLPNEVCYNYNFREGSMRTILMSKEDWRYLFDLISTIIMPIDIGLQAALLQMKIDRMYRLMILKGSYINSKDKLLSDIMESQSIDKLTTEDLRKLRIIKSPVLQRIKFIENRLMLKLRYYTKKLLK